MGERRGLGGGGVVRSMGVNVANNEEVGRILT